MVCGPESSKSIMATRHKVEPMVTKLRIKHGVIVSLVTNQISPGQETPESNYNQKSL